MGILNGDLKNPSKKEQKARAAKFSERDNQKVMNLQARSQSGFKGEKTNEHGLPTGPDLEKKAKRRGMFDTYAKGTDSIKIEKAEPKSVIPKPDISNLPTSTPSMRLTLNDAPEARSDAQIKDMEKVAAYQTKLNKAGAKLKVDGMWGEKTIAASKSYHSKSSSVKRPLSDAQLAPALDRMENRTQPKAKVISTSDPLRTTSQTQTPTVTVSSTGNKKGVMNFKLPEDSIRRKIAAGETINGGRYRSYEDFEASTKGNSLFDSETPVTIKPTVAPKKSTMRLTSDPLSTRPKSKTKIADVQETKVLTPRQLINARRDSATSMRDSFNKQSSEYKKSSKGQDDRKKFMKIQERLKGAAI